MVVQVAVKITWLRLRNVPLQGRDVTPDDVKDAILQLTVTEHYYTGVQDLVTLLCEFNGITVKVVVQAILYVLQTLCRRLFSCLNEQFLCC